jgi:hypothetical protein
MDTNCFHITDKHINLSVVLYGSDVGIRGILQCVLRKQRNDERRLEIEMKIVVLWDIKTPVRTSQETHYFSVTESSQLMLCKI